MRYIDQCLKQLAEADLHSLEPARKRPPPGIKAKPA